MSPMPPSPFLSPSAILPADYSAAVAMPAPEAAADFLSEFVEIERELLEQILVLIQVRVECGVAA